MLKVLLVEVKRGAECKYCWLRATVLRESVKCDRGLQNF